MNLSDSWTPRQPVLSRTSAAEEVFNSIRQGIESGEIPIGSKLGSEASLAASFGVSRSVIREALCSSATLGLTKTETGRGTFVISATPANNLVLGNYSSTDIHEARPHIEVPAAGLAALRRTTDDLKKLQDIMEQMEAEDDHVAWVELDTEFHATIASASKNSVFTKIAESSSLQSSQPSALSLPQSFQLRHLKLFLTSQPSASSLLGALSCSATSHW